MGAKCCELGPASAACVATGCLQAVGWLRADRCYPATQLRTACKLPPAPALSVPAGDESAVMLDAHVEAGMMVGIPFGTPGLYDFGSHGGMTKRVSELGAVMLKHRLTPVRAGVGAVPTGHMGPLQTRRNTMPSCRTLYPKA